MRLGDGVAGPAHVEEHATVFKQCGSGVLGEVFFQDFGEFGSGGSFDGRGHDSLPVLPRAEVGDVRGVMARVPGVERENRGEVLAAVFRVVVAALEVRLGHRLEQGYPALVQGGDHRERAVDGQVAIGESSPCGFVVGLDGGPIFSERELEADVRVRVAVGDVVHQLAHGPAAVAIRRVELSITESADGFLKGGREQAERGYLGGAKSGFRRGRWRETADRVAEVFQFCHTAKNLEGWRGAIVGRLRSVGVLRDLVFHGMFQARIRSVKSLGMLTDARILVRLFVPGEGWDGTHHQQQRGKCNFPHGRNVARDDDEG